MPIVDTANSNPANEIAFAIKARAEMVRILYRTSVLGLLMNVYVGGLLVVMFGWFYPAKGIGWWSLAMALVLAARIGLAMVFKRSEISVTEMARWRGMFWVGSALTGLLWGIAAWMFWAVPELAARLFLIFVIAGMNAGAARTLAAAPACFLTYSILSMTPLMARLAEFREWGYWLLVGMLVTNIVFLWRTTRLQQLDFLRLLQAQFENEALVARLTEEKRRAEGASEAKSEFLTTVSHEIRTPMNGVVGMLQMLQDSNLDAEQREQVEMALKSAECLMRMLDDVLDLSEATQGKFDLARVGFDPEAHVRGMVELLEPQAKAKGLECRVVVAGSAPEFVLGDPARLRQVLAILVGNAIKFTERGSVVVGLSAEMISGEECSVCYSVADTGMGIDELMQAKLFQAFSMGDSKSTRRFGGVGLGLATAQPLIARMGGAIEVESKVGMGSRFSFTLRMPLASRLSAHRVSQ